ncbi:MAG: hypothetical protein H6Q84_1856 [Deltaproteobacteria bacterium]|nr:hypothetical protein [Deltaproteobacteria bacterium]
MKIGDKMKDLFISMKKKEVEPILRLDVEELTEIIHKGRVKNLRSREIAHAVIEYLKRA